MADLNLTDEELALVFHSVKWRLDSLENKEEKIRTVRGLNSVLKKVGEIMPKGEMGGGKWIEHYRGLS